MQMFVTEMHSTSVVFINFISIDAVFYSALIQRDQEKSTG